MFIMKNFHKNKLKHQNDALLLKKKIELMKSAVILAYKKIDKNRNQDYA